VKAHWTCEICKKIYADAEGKTETTLEALTIPQISDIPQAGDNSSIFMMVAIAIVAATSVTALVITKKRFF
jgi:LPXTG-motif cell wall-anchored protein